jgi:hypothetical protein
VFNLLTIMCIIHCLYQNCMYNRCILKTRRHKHFAL